MNLKRRIKKWLAKVLKNELLPYMPHPPHTVNDNLIIKEANFDTLLSEVDVCLHDLYDDPYAKRRAITKGTDSLLTAVKKYIVTYEENERPDTTKIRIHLKLRVAKVK